MRNLALCALCVFATITLIAAILTVSSPVPSQGDMQPYTNLLLPTPTPTSTPTPSATGQPSIIIKEPKETPKKETLQMTDLKIGPSSYPRTLAGAYSTAIIDDIIDYMDTHGLNIYRMSIYYTVSDSVRNSMIQYFLENCSYDLIVCRHVYDPGGSLTSSDWAEIQNWIIEVAGTFSAYADRLYIEPVNECGDSNLGTRTQTLVTTFRNAGYTNPIVVNKWEQNWSSMAITDPLDKFYSGMHFYFNTWSVSNAQTQMGYAQAAGLKVINTEIGADSNEEGSFSASEVQEVNDFLGWCSDTEHRTISNCVWMRYGLQNADTYDTLGLDWPSIAPESPETFTITAEAGANGSVTPSGEVPVTEGEHQAFTWEADEGYKVDTVLVDSEEVVAVGSYTFWNVTANHTITVSFIEEDAVNVSVAASADDCTVEPALTYMQALTDDWVGMGRNATGDSDRNSGLRFLNLTIPDGATILSAKLTGKSYAAYDNTVNLKIRGELSLEPATFSTYANFAARSKTTSAVDWDISTAWALGETVESVDFAAVIQEIVNQEGWASGNDIVLFIENDGTAGTTRRALRAYDYAGNSDGASLYVAYTVESNPLVAVIMLRLRSDV